ncbi:MAG: hypothetical protein FWD82_11020, partial [Defluviitaleaceae bacterium]|nr:hypothetical protein [Defluviitaleaceae bacterium]
MNNNKNDERLFIEELQPIIEGIEKNRKYLKGKARRTQLKRIISWVLITSFLFAVISIRANDGYSDDGHDAFIEEGYEGDGENPDPGYEYEGIDGEEPE